MKTALSRNICMLALLSGGIGGGGASADTLSNNYRCVTIQFSEPVVSLTTVQNSRNPERSDSDRGLDLFTITGDPAHRPEACWEDQDYLVITYPLGSDSRTEYRLQFKPGTQYLSKRPLQQSDYSFTRPSEGSLSAMQLEGTPDSLLVTADLLDVWRNAGWSRELIDFSAESPVTYSFHEVKTDEKGRRSYGREIPATARPATLSDGFSSTAGRLLSLRGFDKWVELTPQSILPGQVVVTPQTPLDAACKWELRATAPAQSGILRMQRLYTDFNPKAELLSSVSQNFNNGQREITVTYSAPISAADVPQLFRSLELSIGGQKATLSPDGNTWTITTGDNRRYKLSLARTNPREQRIHIDRSLPREAQNKLGPVANDEIQYTEPDCAEGYTLSVSGDSAPVTIDLSLPPGAKAKRGLAQQQRHTHRLTLNPAWPDLAQNGAPALLPLKGEHKLRFTARNSDSLTVTARRWEPEAAAVRYPLLRSNLRNTREQQQFSYLLSLVAKRAEQGLQTQYNITWLTQAAGKRPAVYRETAIADATVYPEQHISTGCSDGACDSKEIVLDLDQLTGGDSRPGLYLITIKSRPTAPVRQALTDLGLSENTLDFEADYLVQLSDLMPISGSGAIVLTRRSDGSPLPKGNIRFFNRPDTQADNSPQRPRPLIGRASAPRPDQQPVLLTESTPAIPVTNGVALTENSAELMLATAGDDYIIIEGYGSPRYIDGRSDADGYSPTRCNILDRPIYRPGEIVRLHSILRRSDNNTNAKLPGVSSAQLTVRRPNGEVLLTRTVAINEYGAFDTEFTLPTGDEDITGNYLVNIITPDRAFSYRESIPCQIFRRDSMEGKISLDVKTVSPDEAAITVKARDLNGAGLEGTRVTLTHTDVKAPVPTDDERLIKVQDLNTPFCPTYNPIDSTELTLTLDEQGSATHKVKLPALGNNAAGISFVANATLTNDREENLILDAQVQNIRPGEFYYTLNGNILTLRNSENDKILDKDQSVCVRILSTEQQESTHPNGIIIIKPVTRCLSESNITIPAHCEKGVTIDIPEADPNNSRFLNICLSAKDSQGRELTCTQPYFGPHRIYPGNNNITRVDAECNNGQISLSGTFEADGTAIAIMGIGDKIRPSLLDLKAGRQTVTLPVTPEDCGNIQVTVFQMRPNESGSYERPGGITADCNIPCTAKALTIALDLPKTPSQPGSSIKLSGRVTDAAGAPVDAEVTFYAVDAGMLSLSPYREPDPLSIFCRAQGRSYTPIPLLPCNSAPLPQPLHPGIRIDTEQQQLINAMPGLWLGDLIEGPACIPSLDTRVLTRGLRSRRAADGVFYTGCTAESCNDAVCDGADLCAASAPMGAPVPVAEESGVLRQAAPVASKAAMKAANGSAGSGPAPRLRSNFVPTAFWQGSLRTDADGRFSTEVTLPDTLTTYRVFAVAVDRSGGKFGSAKGDFIVNQPVMLTPGTPLFMSLGDTLRLPVTITNNTDQEDSWEVTLSSAAGPQSIRLGARKTGTLYFDVIAEKEGENILTWTARAAGSSDAVEGRFPVRFPAPVLKESHRLVLSPGQAPIAVAKLLAPELATSTRGSLTIEASANPLLHLAGCAEYVLGYPYGCTEQTASGLMPYLLYKRLAPFSPKMAETPEEEVERTVNDTIAQLLRRQQPDGGLGYWSDSRESCLWASAHAGLIFTIAAENGYDIPREPMEKLRRYLRRELEADTKRPDNKKLLGSLARYSIARCLGDEQLMAQAISEAAGYKPDQPIVGWRNRALPDLSFIAALKRDPVNRHSAFLRWMRSRGHDYRHNTTWQSSWTLIALAEYLRLEPAESAPARLTLGNGQTLTLGNGSTGISPENPGRNLGDISTTLSSAEGSVYVTIKAKALPETREYPGLTEKGLQVTRLYEKKGEDGVWRPATEFAVGDIVRVTLTCAKVADELEYFVLEDYLPSCMEAINPNIPSQAAGLEPMPWSMWFDHREYLPERVRGFCTRWAGRDLLNMRYYARVKRAGSCTAPPAEAQLMYEPQTYGLSENVRIISK